MRLHPAVACTMLIVGAIMLLAPVLIWAWVVGEGLSWSNTEMPVPFVLVELLSALLGLILILLGMLFSFTSPKSGDRA